MGSLVSIVGTITNTIRRTEEGLCRFSVDTEDGRFYIQIPWSLQLENICHAEPVHIIGTLHSFTFRRCCCHHVYIEPLAIMQSPEVSILTARGH